VAATLATLNLGTVVGLRDRAILTLLAVYGLRSCEAARIRLDDILWRAETLRIRHRRCGDTLELPLLPAAAKALADYIRVRPETVHREVFLTKFRPHHPIHDSAVGQAAREALKRAGIEVARSGAHTFRYSHAQALFEAETPLPEIAGALGHSDLRTTLGYLQITVHPLREVAINDGEELA
jgi:integrase